MVVYFTLLALTFGMFISLMKSEQNAKKGARSDKAKLLSALVANLEKEQSQDSSSVSRRAISDDDGSLSKKLTPENLPYHVQRTYLVGDNSISFGWALPTNINGHVLPAEALEVYEKLKNDKSQQ